MGIEKPKDGAPGTTEQSPRWEGPEASRPRGYLPAKDDPDVDRDAAGENNADPERSSPSDALKVRNDAKGQYAPSRADRSGVTSAKPPVNTGPQDVTGHLDPSGRERETDQDNDEASRPPG